MEWIMNSGKQTGCANCKAFDADFLDADDQDVLKFRITFWRVLDLFSIVVLASTFFGFLIAWMCYADVRTGYYSQGWEPWWAHLIAQPAVTITACILMVGSFILIRFSRVRMFDLTRKLEGARCSWIVEEHPQHGLVRHLHSQLPEASLMEYPESGELRWRTDELRCLALQPLALSFRYKEGAGVDIMEWHRATTADPQRSDWEEISTSWKLLMDWRESVRVIGSPGEFSFLWRFDDHSQLPLYELVDFMQKFPTFREFFAAIKKDGGTLTQPDYRARVMSSLLFSLRTRLRDRGTGTQLSVGLVDDLLGLVESSQFTDPHQVKLQLAARLDELPRRRRSARSAGREKSPART